MLFSLVEPVLAVRDPGSRQRKMTLSRSSAPPQRVQAVTSMLLPLLRLAVVARNGVPVP